MAQTMKAQVFYEPLKMELQDVPVPQVGPDEVLIRVKACGICGSDVAYYFGDSSLETETGKGPLILGHEFTGEVVEVGEIPKRLGLFKPGDRVVLDPVQYCNACRVCKKGQVNLCENKQVLGVSTNGGFAEYCISNFTGMHKIPEGVSYQEAALTEPLACAVHAVGRMNVHVGDTCVVVGPGTIGNMLVQLIKAAGAGQVVAVGTRDYRLRLAQEAGADAVFNTKEKGSPFYTDNLKKEIEQLTGGLFADGVITATGSVEAMEDAFEISGRRARIVFFGLPADVARVRVPALESILWDKTIHFSWLAPLTWPTALDAIASGKVNVKPLVSRTVGLSDLVGALKDVKDRVGDPMKVVVSPS